MQKKYRYNIEYSVQGTVEMTDEQYKEFKSKNCWLPDQEEFLEEIIKTVFLATDENIVNIDLNEVIDESRNN